MDIRRRAVVGTLLVLLGTGEARAADAAVDARTVPYVFSPANLTIAVGGTVVWTMLGEPHTVTSGTIDGFNVGHPDGRFDSGTRLVGEQYSLTFTEPGAFPYFCIIHADSQMKGTITVSAAATPAPTPAPSPIATPAPTPRRTASPVPTAPPTSTPIAESTSPPTPTPATPTAPGDTPTPRPSATPTLAAEAAPSTVETGPPTAGGSLRPAADGPPAILVGLAALIAIGVGGAAALVRRRR